PWRRARRRPEAPGSRRTSRPRSPCSPASDPDRGAGPSRSSNGQPPSSPSARRQADRLARGLQRRVRAIGPEPVEDGCVRELDGVSRPGGRAAPPVDNDEHDERDRAQPIPLTAGAASTIAAKESTSSDAPPTSAPSTSGLASSSAALSGLIEPPYRIGTLTRPRMN